MFFEQETIPFMILNVLELHQQTPPCHNIMKSCNALSFRYEADTEIETKSHSFHFTDNAISFFPANIRYTRTARYDHVIVVHFLYFGQDNREIEYFYPENAEKYRSNFLRLLHIWQRKDKAYKMEASSVLCEIFADIYTERGQSTANNPLLCKAADYLSKNYCNPELSVKHLAEMSHMSEVYFRRLFKAEYGVSPKKYIIDLRIKHATELIATGYYSLPEVSDMTGFTDYRHFSVTFKKSVGCSPSKYMHKGIN